MKKSASHVRRSLSKRVPAHSSSRQNESQIPMQDEAIAQFQSNYIGSTVQRSEQVYLQSVSYNTRRVIKIIF